MGFWFKVGVLGFWALGLGFKGLVKGFGLRVLGLRFRVRVRLGFWCRV